MLVAAVKTLLVFFRATLALLCSILKQNIGQISGSLKKVKYQLGIGGKKKIDMNPWARKYYVVGDGDGKLIKTGSHV